MLPFRTLLYRYFFYGWLFRDASHGNLWERAASVNHNREQARWLPTYMRRWLVVATLLFAIAMVFEAVLSLPLVSALFYVPSVLSAPFNAVTAIAWVFLVHGKTF